jgi:predicted DNA-binding transcriptional regulator YafY
MLDELLSITREIEKSLGVEDTEKLVDLLARRREIAGRLDSQACTPEEAWALLHGIRECEERCTAVARVQAEQVQAELLAVRGQRKLERAYGGQR